MYLAADIERFQKLSQQLKGAKGSSALGYCSNEYSKLTSQPISIEAVKNKERDVKSPSWIKNNSNYMIQKIAPSNK